MSILLTRLNLFFDFLSLETSKGNIGNILSQQITTASMLLSYQQKYLTARTTAEAFYNNFITLYQLDFILTKEQISKVKSSKNYLK
jgi:hypothetical protein